MKGDAVFVLPDSTLQGLKTQMWGTTSLEEVPPAILNWLVRARLLYGVPFEYLVPDASLLPPESIRFFFLDHNWTDALVDGAVSVGKSTSWEYLHHERRSELLRQRLDEAGPAVRTDARENNRKTGEWADSSQETEVTGFLLRSSLVSAFPGMEIRAYLKSDLTKPMRPLRIDRPAPDLLLAMFPGVAAKVVLREPSEGIVTGLNDNAEAYLRDPDANKLLTSAPTPLSVVHSQNGRIEIADLVRSLTISGPETPAALAAALLLMPTELTFDGPAPAPLPPNPQLPPERP
ncbi:MAG: hypothetical protein QM817_40905 [Archangium sp.]